jgi:hypothetical protein
MTTKTANSLLRAGVVCGVFGVGGYVTDTWIRGDGQLNRLDALAGTCLVIALVLVTIALNRLMRGAPK